MVAAMRALKVCVITPSGRRVCGTPTARPSGNAAASKGALTIAHSTEFGTEITGDTLAAREAIKALRTSFKWYAPRASWYRTSSRGRPTPSVPLETWASRLRDAGFDVTVAAPESLSAAEAAAKAAEVARERADALSGRADKKMGAANEVLDGARTKLDRIPFGQPIHGHRDRSYREKAVASMGRGFALADEAKAVSLRAAAADRKADRLEADAAALAAGSKTVAESEQEFFAAVLAALPKAVKKTYALPYCRVGSKGTGAHPWAILRAGLPEQGFANLPEWQRSIDLHLRGAFCEIGPAGNRFAVVTRQPDESSAVFTNRVVATTGEYLRHLAAR